MSYNKLKTIVNIVLRKILISIFLIIISIMLGILVTSTYTHFTSGLGESFSDILVKGCFDPMTYFAAAIVGLIVALGTEEYLYGSAFTAMKKYVDKLKESKPVHRSGLMFLSENTENVSRSLENALIANTDLLWEYEHWGLIQCICNDTKKCTCRSCQENLQKFNTHRRLRVTTVCSELVHLWQLRFCATETKKPSILVNDAEFRKKLDRKLMPWTKGCRLLLLSIEELKTELSDPAAGLADFIDWHVNGRLRKGDRGFSQWRYWLRKKINHGVIYRLRIVVFPNRHSVTNLLREQGVANDDCKYIDCAIYGRGPAYVFAQSGSRVLLRNAKHSRKRVKAYKEWYEELWGNDKEMGGSAMKVNSQNIYVSGDIRTVSDVRSFVNNYLSLGVPHEAANTNQIDGNADIRISGMSP